MNDSFVAKQYRTIPLESLISVPSRMQLNAARAEMLAQSLDERLNELAEEGWDLVTSWKSASGTMFIFKSVERPENASGSPG